MLIAQHLLAEVKLAFLNREILNKLFNNIYGLKIYFSLSEETDKANKKSKKESFMKNNLRNYLKVY